MRLSGWQYILITSSHFCITLLCNSVVTNNGMYCDVIFFFYKKKRVHYTCINYTLLLLLLYYTHEYSLNTASELTLKISKIEQRSLSNVVFYFHGIETNSTVSECFVDRFKITKIRQRPSGLVYQMLMV